MQNNLELESIDEEESFQIDTVIRNKANSIQSRESMLVKQFKRVETSNNKKNFKFPTSLIPEPRGDLDWPFFKVSNSFQVKTFWNQKKKIEENGPWYQSEEDILFSAIMYRIGKKKKSLKGYYFKITNQGLLLYYKKENDLSPKGYLQLNFMIRASILVQRTKNQSLPMIFIERVHGLGITIFDHESNRTMTFFDHLKHFCLVRGYDAYYTQLEMLGKGSFASVYKVKRLFDEKVYAAKIYFQEVYSSNQHRDKFQQMVYNEIQSLKELSHQGIMQIHEIIQEKDKLVIVLEFVAGGTLYQLLRSKKRISEKTLAVILRNIMESLYEMHKNNFVHRDLKLENIMIESKEHYQTKLVDFGFAEKINAKELVSKAGTPGFIPPEVFRMHPYTAKGDIFSIGVIYYTLITSSTPFKAKNVAQIIELNKKCQVDFEKVAFTEVSPELKQLVKKMLEQHPEERASALEILENSWVILNTETQASSGLKQMISILENESKIHKSVKSINQSGESRNSKEFHCDFSYATGDLKSLYQKNSLKTLNSQKSEIGGLKQSQQLIHQRSISANVVRNELQKTYTMKASIHKKIHDDDSLRSLREDDTCIRKENIQFMQHANKIFNQPKKIWGS